MLNSYLVLVMVSVRLGLDKINTNQYMNELKSYFECSQSIGIVGKVLMCCSSLHLPDLCFEGGRPNSSYYFIGTVSNCFYYLDPHTVQYYVPLSNNNTNTKENNSTQTITSVKHNTKDTCQDQSKLDNWKATPFEVFVFRLPTLVNNTLV